MPPSSCAPALTKSVAPALIKSTCCSNNRICSVCKIGVLISCLNLACANCDTPPSWKGSSNQKKLASSQARPNLIVSEKFLISHAGSIIRSIELFKPEPRLRTLSISLCKLSRAFPHPCTLNAGYPISLH